MTTIRALALTAMLTTALLAPAAPAEARRPGRPLPVPVERIDIRKPAGQVLPTTPRRPIPIQRTDQRRWTWSW